MQAATSARIAALQPGGVSLPALLLNQTLKGQHHWRQLCDLAQWRGLSWVHFAVWVVPTLIVIPRTRQWHPKFQQQLLLCRNVCVYNLLPASGLFWLALQFVRLV